MRNRSFIPLWMALLTIAMPAAAANLLVNPGFEANSGRILPVGWTRFAPPTAQPAGNYWIEGAVTPHSGLLYWKQWGAAYQAGVSNVAGIYQDFSSAPGSVYQASGWFYTRASDVLGSNCKTWLEVLFLDANTNLVALFKSEDFTAAAGTDTWLPYPVTLACDVATPVPSGDPYFTTYAVTGTVSQIVAPAGTATVRFRYAYSQAGIEGGSAYFDDAVLDQVSGPLPPVIAGLLPLNMIFVNPNEGISFTATSPSGLTIENSGISLVVNSTNVSTNLVISGSASSKNVAYHGLESNRVYTAAITVTDAVGFTATANTYFETTWVGTPPVAFVWEAEDYDFGGGQYVNDPELCNSAGNPNCYFGKTGIEGIDFHNLTAGGSHLYRPDDPVPTGVAGDLSRKPLVAAGRSDYRIDPFITGEWLNYTRDWPAGTYWVSARLATGEGLSGTLTLSRVNPDTTTTDLGTFSIASGKGWTAYENVFLRDADGNIAVVALDGKDTLRLTSGGNLLPGFYMLSVAQLDLPVLTKLYPTGTRPFEHTNALSFTVSTVGATFPEGGLKVNLNGVDISSLLVITGSESQKEVRFPHLLPDAVHTAVIAITNSAANGISVTNHFDTFNPENFMVETEDFDYDGGQFVADWLPGAYFGLGATTNVDFQHSVIPGEQFPYRLQGVPQEIARDYLRPEFVMWGATDYQLAWFGAGDWAGYTRDFPTNTYFIYVRTAGFGTFSMELDQVVSGEGTESQATRRLGYWVGSGRDNQTHGWVALTDAGQEAPRPVELGGRATLRLSTSTGNCHPSYFLFVPAVGIVLSAARSENGVSISFPSQVGVQYRVYYRDNLAASGGWRLLDSLVGDGAVMTVNDATASARFYTVTAP